MIKHKWLSFFPFLLLSIVMAILFWCYKTDFTARTFSWYVIHTLTDLFPLQFLGFNGSFPTGVAWYLSVLLFLSFVFFPILVKYKDKFIPYFAPIIMFGTYGYICYVSNGTICSITVWTGVTVLGMLRGVGDMILGFIAYYFTKKLDGVERSVSQKVWITVAECFCYISVIVFVFFYGQADSMDFYIILLLFIAISISFSKQSYLGKIFNAKICGFLGVFSLSIYLNHFYVITKVGILFGDKSYPMQYIISLSIIALCSIYNYVIGTMIAKLIKRKGAKKEKLPISI